MDGSVGTRKDKTAVAKRKTLNIPVLFEASGLPLPLLLGQVLSTLLSLYHWNRKVTESGKKRGDVMVCNHLFSFLEAFSPGDLNSPFIFTLMVPSSAFSSSSLSPSVPFFSVCFSSLILAFSSPFSHA